MTPTETPPLNSQSTKNTNEKEKDWSFSEEWIGEKKPTPLKRSVLREVDEVM